MILKFMYRKKYYKSRANKLHNGLRVVVWS
jgi:hypothetical protein